MSKKTGPKPSHEKFIARCAVKGFVPLEKYKGEYELHRSVHRCGLKREIRGHARGMNCSCEHKRPFYLVKRTVKTHNIELKTVKPGYKCIELAPKGKGHNTYKCLKCSNQFKASFDCLKGSAIPCPDCRPTPNFLNTKQYKQRLVSLKLSKFVEPIEAYKGCSTKIKHRYVECGHIKMMEPLTRPNRPVCRVCYPAKFSRGVILNDFSFNVRSQAEVLLLEKAQALGYTDIEYEPIDARIQYKHPFTRKLHWFRPDFRIEDKVIELKDSATLGLTAYFYGDMPKEKLLSVNRSKARAALKKFDNFRFVILHKGKLKHIPNELWQLPLKELRVQLQNLIH